LQERIAELNLMVGNPADVRRDAELILPSEQAALNELLTRGPKALHPPLVRWGLTSAILNPRPVPHFGEQKLLVEWFEVGSQVTGFFLELQDGSAIDFPGTYHPEESEAELEGYPMRVGQFGFSKSNDAPQFGISKISPELFATLFEQREAKRVGLILRDGTRTATGPLGHYDEYLEATESEK
jgi:hypothetical protein